MISAYLDNAARMWTALVPDARVTDGCLRAERPQGVRLIPLSPADVPAALHAESPARAVVLENVFSETGPVTPDSRAVRMPVMVRQPAPLRVALAPEVRVTEVGDADELAAAERIMVDGFPLRGYQPYVRASALPPRLLSLPEWRVWLAYRHARPAAAAYTYDDGTAVGVYWLATLPEHRSAGLGRAIMTTAVAAYPSRIFTLVATDAGRPLYESLGFRAAATATWHFRDPLISVRDARESDAPEIARLLGQLGYPSTAAEVAERLAYWFGDPYSKVLVAGSAGRLAGSMSLHAIPYLERTGRMARIESLVVDAGLRGGGVGRLLVSAGEDIARQWGCVTMEVTSSRRRDDAHAFYQRLGYTDQCQVAGRFLKPLA
jgi:GNAT superfamily N-acetyltransferase